MDLLEGISIIVCCHNSSQILPELLQHLNGLEMSDLNVEVIIIDNLSTDSTFQIAEAFFETSSIKGVVLTEPNLGLSFARKKGVLAASYSLVLFCDDDNFLEKDYLQIGFSLFRENPRIGCLGGLGIPQVSRPLPNWFGAFAHSYAVGSLGKSDGIQPMCSIHYGAGLFFRREALLKFYERQIDSPITDRKGNSLSSGGDSELCLAIQLEGYELAYDSRLRFYHKLEDERISEKYYLELRKGIASHFPILESYEFMLKKERGDFRIYLLSLFSESLYAFVKTFIKYQLKRDFKSQVYFVVFSVKLKSLLKNYSNSVQLFRRLKSVYN